MKKIIIPFSGEHFSRGAFDFAGELNALQPILLTGVFLPEVDYARFLFFPTSYAAPAYVPLFENADDEAIADNVERFKQFCLTNTIEYRVHENLYEFAIKELTKETRFADAMILGASKFFKVQGGGTNEYLKDALHVAECPVVIVPEEFTFPDTIMLAYDGSESSVYSIRQFASTFPELCSRKTLLFHIEEKKKQLPDKILIEELVARHFSDLTITSIASESMATVSNLMREQQNPMLVSGSFGRSGLSVLFRKNFVMDVIEQGLGPVFVAHR